MRLADSTARGEILYDSGRVPLLIRVPCLLLAFLCLAILFDLAVLLAFDRTVLLPPPTDLPAGWLVAFAGTAVLAAFMLSVWVGRTRIIWDAELGVLQVEGRWLFGTTRRNLPQAELAVVRIRHGRILGSSAWNVSLLDSSGRENWLTQLNTEAVARSLGERIAEATHKPLELT